MGGRGGGGGGRGPLPRGGDTGGGTGLPDSGRALCTAGDRGEPRRRRGDGRHRQSGRVGVLAGYAAVGSAACVARGASSGTRNATLDSRRRGGSARRDR